MRPQRGVVLILTMVVLTALALMAAFFAERIERALALAGIYQSNVDAQIALSNDRAELLYRLTTQYFTPEGLGVGESLIRLDGRPYTGISNSIIQLQDNRGLLNLWTVTDMQLRRIFGAVGVPADVQGQLIDVYRDYVDADSLRRLEGAEAAEYKLLNLPSPPNGPVYSPRELRTLPSWRDQKVLWRSGASFDDLVTVGSATLLNPNTAPKEILMTLDGVNAEVADAIIARRNLEPILNSSVIGQLVGAGSSMQYQMYLLGFPGDSVRVTQFAPGLPWAVRYNISLTPTSNDAPWRIDYYYKFERSRNDPYSNLQQAARHATPLPPRGEQPVEETFPSISIVRPPGL